MSPMILWSLALFIPISFIILIKHVITPFIFSLIIAYLLNPLVDKLNKFRIPRSLSAMTIIVLAFISVLTFVFVMAPTLYSQSSIVLNILMTYLSSLQHRIYSEIFNGDVQMGYGSLLIKKYANEILSIVTKFSNNIWSSTIAMINIISLVFITPVITFYTLRDWPILLSTVSKIIPRKHHTTIIEQITKIDDILSAYIRGQTQVCLLLSLFYSICLYFAGLQYSLFIGLFTGLLSFIPYIGFAIGFIIGNIVSFAQFDSLLTKGIIILIFILGQILEGTIITPKLIGSNVKLHPVWVIFAIFTGGTLFGFAGVLLAIPVAAIVGVIIRFYLQGYFKSAFYKTTQLTQ